MRSLAFCVIILSLARADALEGARQTAIAVSGAVSLGSFEAGYLHRLLEAIRADPNPERATVFTGTSAGSINAFLAALSSCRPAVSAPTEDLLYQTWIPLGLDQLFDPKKTTPISLFHREASVAALARVRAVWDQGLGDGCQVVVGLTATRLVPRTIHMSGARLPRMSEKFIFRMIGHGPGRPPTVENIGTHDFGRELALLPFTDNADPFASIAEVLLASSGFPIAFAPQPIRHCLARWNDGPIPRCRVADAMVDDFVDGGFFDNRPLDLAVAALAAESPTHQVPDGVSLFILDPHSFAWSRPMEVAEKPRDLFALVLGTATHFIDAAMATELTTLLSRQPQLEERLLVARTYFPQASDPLNAFFGFIDRDFRRFDYFLGMYSAERQLEEASLVTLAQPKHSDETDAVLGCMRAYYDQPADQQGDQAANQAGRACTGPALGNLERLIMLSLDRIYDECRRAPPRAGHDPHPQCRQARHKQPPPTWHGATLDWKSRSGESEIVYVMRLLGALGYRFTDLGLGERDSGRAMIHLRERLGTMASSITRKQGSLSTLLGLAGEVALNEIHYLPPRHVFHILVSDRLEAGWSYTAPTGRANWLRLATAVAFGGIDSLLSSRPSYFGLEVLAGVEFQPLLLSRPQVQVRFGIRGGFVFSTIDGFLSQPCPPSSLSPCSSPELLGHIALSALSFLRVQLTGGWIAATHPNQPQAWMISPGIGIQLPYAGRLR